MIIIRSSKALRVLWTTLLGAYLLVMLASCGGSTTGSIDELPKASVRVVKTPQGFKLERNGKPFRLRGAGGTQYYDRLKEAGGNTVRLWSAEYAGPLLDEAHRNGLTVMLGLWLEPEGKSIDYYDRTSVQAQLQRLREQVLRFRHHPALLMWNVGNELDLAKPNPELYSAMNEVALMIRELDPAHLITTSLANPASASFVVRWAPAIDIISINSYAGFGDLPAKIRETTWTGPYIVTEFGPMGYWEADKSPWGAPREQSSAQKAAFTAVRYRQTVIADSNRCLGSYVFFWGRKFEKTSSWFSLFNEKGEKTLLVDSMRYLWSGKRPANFSPSVVRLELAGQRDGNFPRLSPNTSYPLSAIATDPDGDALTAVWELWPELAPESDAEERTEALSGYISHATAQGATLRTPMKPGAYRLLLTVHDGHRGIGTANIPFFCGSETDL